MAGTPQREVWVDFADPRWMTGLTWSPVALAAPGADLSPGARLVAGDGKGTFALATVRGLTRPGPAGLVLLEVDASTLGRGPPAPAGGAGGLPG